MYMYVSGIEVSIIRVMYMYISGIEVSRIRVMYMYVSGIEVSRIRVMYMYVSGIEVSIMCGMLCMLVVLRSVEYVSCIRMLVVSILSLFLQYTDLIFELF
jgi:hypothetical protein